jgi:hypothetical protein
LTPTKNMYLPEAAVSDAINAWIRSVFRPGSAALTDPLNRAQERVVAARLERDRAPSHRSLGRAEVEAMLDHLALRWFIDAGDAGEAGRAVRPVHLIYRADDRLVVGGFPS